MRFSWWDFASLFGFACSRPCHDLPGEADAGNGDPRQGGAVCARENPGAEGGAPGKLPEHLGDQGKRHEVPPKLLQEGPALQDVLPLP